MTDGTTEEQETSDELARGIDRRTFVKTVAAGVGAVGVTPLLADVARAASRRGASAAVKRGGTIRAAITPFDPSDSLDPAQIYSTGGYAMNKQLYDTLAGYGPQGEIQHWLAEEIIPEAPDRWVVRVRDAEWHNGKPVTADDVMYTFRRAVNPKKPLPNAAEIAFIDPNGMRKLDARTVRFQFKYGAMFFPDTLCSPTQALVPVGFNIKKPIGTGPFSLASFTPGQRATFDRFDSYWRPNQPYVDRVIFIGFPSGTSQVNALIGGQADVAPGIDPSLVRVVKAAGRGHTVFGYHTSATLTWQMNVQKPPFNDIRARQALRLAVDRKQIVEQVYGGHALIGNDLFGPYDEFYARDIPQREQDIDKARALLRAAGHPQVAVQLTAAPILATADHQNDVLVTQAKTSGFKIDFRKVDVATYYGKGYGHYPLSLSFWGLLNIMDQAAFTKVKSSPYNATHWNDPEYNKLFLEAARQKNKVKRRAIMHRMQEIEWQRGTYVVAEFVDSLTGYSSKLTGYKPYPNGQAASDFGFRELWFKA
jgi:peptide/nickel transport system substrate-binding protein